MSWWFCLISTHFALIPFLDTNWMENFVFSHTAGWDSSVERRRNSSEDPPKGVTELHQGRNDVIWTETTRLDDRDYQFESLQVRAFLLCVVLFVYCYLVQRQNVCCDHQVNPLTVSLSRCLLFFTSFLTVSFLFCRILSDALVRKRQQTEIWDESKATKKAIGKYNIAVFILLFVLYTRF